MFRDLPFFPLSTVSGSDAGTDKSRIGIDVGVSDPREQWTLFPYLPENYHGHEQT